MKKIMLAAIAITTMIACKKEIPADVEENITEVTDSIPTTNVAVDENAALLAQAKANPLTHAVLSQSHYEFGKIKKGDKVEHSYEITNTGNNPLIITEVKPACGCTAPSYTKDPILPGKTGKITLSFDSTNFDGIVNKQAEVYANVEGAPILLTFSAEIQP